MLRTGVPDHLDNRTIVPSKAHGIFAEWQSSALELWVQSTSRITEILEARIGQAPWVLRLPQALLVAADFRVSTV